MPGKPSPEMLKRGPLAYLGCVLIIACVLTGIAFAWRRAGAAEPAQRITTSSLRILQQTADSAIVVVRWTQSNADTVRVSWSYPGLTALRAATGTRRADTVRLGRGTVVQQACPSLTAKRGAIVGNTRSACINIPARPALPTPAPSIGSISVDTTRPPVTPPPTSAASNFYISPDVIALRSGETRQINPQVFWAGTPGSYTVSWSATGGTISNTGLYTAGATAGSFVIVARCSCFTRPDTGLVTVTTGTTTPPVDTQPTTPPVVTPPTVGWAANLPAGMQLIAETSFENYVDGSNNADGIEVVSWAQNTVQSPTTHGVRGVATSGGYGSRSIRAWFPGNHKGEGVGPLTMGVDGLNSREHYMVTRMRYSPNYVFHTNSEKLFYPVQAVAGQTWGAATLNVSCCGHLVGVAGPIQAAPVGEPKTLANVVPIGVWFTAEFYARMNTPGQSDGIWQAWINGVRVMNITNWQFSNNPTTQMLFTKARQDMTRGGGNSDILTPPEGQWVEVDRLAFFKR